MNSLLVNEEDAREFCRAFLLPYRKPRLLEYVARNKYAPTTTTTTIAGGEKQQRLSKSSKILDRKILSFDDDRGEDNFIPELRKLEVLAAAGMFTDRKSDAPIPIEWTVVYVTAYPLDEDDASDAFISHVVERRQEARRGSAKQQQRQQEKSLTTARAVAVAAPVISRTIGLMQTFLHQSPCRQHRMLKLDVDTKEPSLLGNLYRSMADCVIEVALETRGGYHVIVKRGPSCQKLWKFAACINNVATMALADQWITIEDNNGPMIAIPGTNQGGFTVRNVTTQWQEAVRRSSALESSITTGKL